MAQVVVLSHSFEAQPVAAAIGFAFPTKSAIRRGEKSTAWRGQAD